MIILHNWCGRLGNNIIQLMNILHISLYYHHSVRLLNHAFFDLTCVNDLISEHITFDTQNDIELTDPNNFFSRHIKNIPIEVYNVNIEKVISILRSIFIIKKALVLDPKDVVLHIRSGDIFDRYPHPGYIVPPLSYYINILDNNVFNKVIIITEDTRNPVINKLIELYPNIIYKKQSLVDDIQTILGAHNVVMSVGTFIPSLLLFSDNIKNVYKSSYINNLFINNNNINIHNTDLDEYRSKMSPWKNTPEQQDIILTFPVKETGK